MQDILERKEPNSSRIAALARRISLGNQRLTAIVDIELVSLQKLDGKTLVVLPHLARYFGIRYNKVMPEHSRYRR